MRIDIITLFPKMFEGPFKESIIKRAQEKGLLEIKIHNLRDWTENKRGTVDDRPYGGGAGMVLMIEPVDRALKSLRLKNSKVILLTPQGKVFNQEKANKLSREKHLIFLCGHYEGIDERVREHLVDEEVSIGDYILTGGEIPAMAAIDTIARLIPGVLAKKEATQNESFSLSPSTKNQTPIKTLEYPQYTRPENFHGLRVPEILLSGDHQKIKKWRVQKSLEKTKSRRPDLL